MNRNKISSQLLYAIDTGSYPEAKFRVQITRTLSNLFAAHCLLGINGNQIESAEISAVADVVLEQVVVLSTDENVTFISLIAGPNIRVEPPTTGC